MGLRFSFEFFRFFFLPCRAKKLTSFLSTTITATKNFPGVPFRGSRLRVRRPNNYDSAAAALLGPTDPDPSVDASRLGAVRTSVADGPDKVFVGGLPCDWDADRVKRLLAPYGRLAAFNLVMDKSTGNSKGYAFCEFADSEFFFSFFIFFFVFFFSFGREKKTDFFSLSQHTQKKQQRAPPTTASPRCTARPSGPSS